MTNNDVLRRLRYIFDYGDDRMIAIFGLGGRVVSRAEVSDWLKSDDAPSFAAIEDIDLAGFLDGLIVTHRGPRDGATRPPETRLTNNIVLTKLKIALSLRSEDILALLASVGFAASAHELSALARKPQHRSYRPCRDQLLRKLLQGLQLQHRGDGFGDDEPPTA
jgi:uncharacterized protein YehS (DUF1456 family)